MSEHQSGRLFDQALGFPDAEAMGRLSSLVGLDDFKHRLTKMLAILINRSGLSAWAQRYHPEADRLVDVVTRRPPLIVLAGDVGCGKTELAETIGDAVARQERIEISLYPLSLATRGQGRVGEMTQLLSAAFDQVGAAAARLRAANGKNRGGVILLVDEADAIAQSRETSQMHHEDRAGVNAFIRGIDRIAAQRLPAAVILCTNRPSALDPAVQRRAADILVFRRPDDQQRAELLASLLSGVGFTGGAIRELVRETGPTRTRDYGYTYSDLTQRLIPRLVLDAYPDHAVSADRALRVVRELEPTPPFVERSAWSRSTR